MDPNEKLTPGARASSALDTPVSFLREYLPNMYEVRLASGVVVVPSEDLERVD